MRPDTQTQNWPWRLSWLGHLLWLSAETLARKALKYCKRPAERKNSAGGLKTTWLSVNSKRYEQPQWSWTENYHMQMV